MPNYESSLIALHSAGSFKPSEWDTIAAELHPIGSHKEVQRFLRLRHHWTAADHLKTRESTRKMVENAHKSTLDSPNDFFFVQSKEDGEFIGVASYIARLPLRRLNRSLPPYRWLRNIPGVLAEAEVPVSGANITAWVDNRRAYSLEELSDAYRGLREHAQELHRINEAATPDVWTIEPWRTKGAGLSIAIGAAGLNRAGVGYYDDAEQNKHRVLASTLYVATSPAPETVT